MSWCPVGGGVEGGDGGEGGEEGGDGGGVTGGGAEARAHRARRRSGARAKLPNKPMDWQVYVHSHSLYILSTSPPSLVYTHTQFIQEYRVSHTLTKSQHS